MGTRFFFCRSNVFIVINYQLSKVVVANSLMSQVKCHAKKPYRYTSTFYRLYKKSASARKISKIPSNGISLPDQPSKFSLQEIRDDGYAGLEEIDVEIPEIRDDSNADLEEIDGQMPNDMLEDDIVTQKSDSQNITMVNNGIELATELQQWAVSHKITHIALNDLLSIFRNCGYMDLPRDSRTLLKTKPKIELTEMGQGNFWYYGLKANLKACLLEIEKPQTISLMFNVDGIKPFTSSQYEFWPILFRICEFPELQPMVVAVYYGTGKPPLDEYFSHFVVELSELLTLRRI